MNKNLLSVVAIILSVIAIIVVSVPQKNISVSSLTLKDSSGKVWAVIDANHHFFTIYNPSTGRDESNWNKNHLFEIETVEDGVNLILAGKDGRERIRLSTWGSNRLSIMDEGWDKSITLGDLWYQDENGEWQTWMGGLVLENDGKQEIVFKIRKD